MSRVHTEATRIHRVNDLSFSTETAMRASTYVAADVGKVYRCTGSGHIYVLASVGPATFRRLTSDTVSVKDHGATGDGTTDDSAAIASAAARLLELGGGVLEFPAGTYLMSSRVDISCSVCAVGTKGASFVKRSDAYSNGPLLNISGSAGSLIEFAVVDGLEVDGNDAGSIVWSSPISNDVNITYAERVCVQNSLFRNTRYTSLYIAYCEDVKISRVDFRDGVASSGSASATTAFHASCYYATTLLMEGCTFETDITYDPGVGYDVGSPQATVASASPTALAAFHCDNVTFRGNTSVNAGCVELYEDNYEVVVEGNIFDGPHLPAVKIQNYKRAVVLGNIIKDCKHHWGASIMLGSYSRLATYGTLSPNQGSAVISGNQIKNNKARDGAIFAAGVVYSTADLDARITYQASGSWISSFGTGTLNHVRKSGSDYYYEDWDGEEYLLTEDYLKAHSIVCSNNAIDGFATMGVYVYATKSAKIVEGTITGCGSIDTPYSYTKTAIQTYEVKSAVVSKNHILASEDDSPKVGGVATSINGITAKSTTLYRRLSSVDISNNEVRLNHAGYAVYAEGHKSLRVKDNDLTTLVFYSANSSWLKFVGVNDSGRIGGNVYGLEDNTYSPSESLEYQAAQACFLSLVNDDDIHGRELTQRRMTANFADFDTAINSQQLAGEYKVGDKIIPRDLKGKAYFRCETAGYWAPTYSGAVTYLKGHKCRQATYYYAAKDDLASGTAPPGTATSDANWEYLDSNTEASIKFFGTKSYTPTITASVGTPSLGNGTIAGRYTRSDEFSMVNVNFTIGSTTTLGTGELRFSIPTEMVSVTQSGVGSWFINDGGAADYCGTAKLSASASYITCRVNGAAGMTFSSPVALAAGDNINMTVVYNS